MQRWEYCVIAGVKVDSIGTIEGHYPRLHFFSMRGIAKSIDLGKGAAKNRPSGWEKVTEGGYIAYTIAALGNEGWEMVGTGYQYPGIPGGTGESHCIYFRRPIE
jgi:hypothetical protein